MTNLSTTIDAYGTLVAQIAELEKKRDALKKELKVLDAGIHEGDSFILTISQSERSVLDMEAVREKLTPQFLRAHTTLTPVTTFRTKARVQVEG